MRTKKYVIQFGNIARSSDSCWYTRIICSNEFQMVSYTEYVRYIYEHFASYIEI